LFPQNLFISSLYPFTQVSGAETGAKVAVAQVVKAVQEAAEKAVKAIIGDAGIPIGTKIGTGN